MPINEAFGWVWVLAGFLSGLVLGLFFQRDDWLGGYGSFHLLFGIPVASLVLGAVLVVRGILSP